MSFEFDKHIEAVEDAQGAPLDAAVDSMAFVSALWRNFVEKGYVKDGEVDLTVMEGIIDGLEGELVAACLLLAEDSFRQVPAMLLQLAATLENHPDAKGTVPVSVIKGYRRLAERIEKTRVTVSVSKKVLENEAKLT